MFDIGAISQGTETIRVLQFKGNFYLENKFLKIF